MKGVRRQWDAFDDYVLRRLHANGRSSKWIAAFMCCAVCTIQRRAKPLGLVFDEKHRWTPVEDALLRKRYPDEPAAAIAKDLGLRVPQVHQHAKFLGLKKSEAFYESDRAGRILRGRTDPRMTRNQFKCGHTTWNKGTHYTAGGRSAETRFKKGRPAHEARNYVPIGTEKYDTKRGVIVRKLTDDPSIFPACRWKPVHVIVWEAANGPVPPGHIVRFKTGMKTLVSSEITVDRLELVTLAENMRLNSIHNLPKPLKEVVQLRGRLVRQINKREGKHEKQHRRPA